MTQDLIAAATVLADVLACENAALKRLDFPAAVALVPAKEAALSGVTGNQTPAAVTSRNPALVTLGSRLRSLAAENRMLLERAITVQTRIVGIIVRAAAKPPAAGHYAADGSRCQSRMSSATTLAARA